MSEVFLILTAAEADAVRGPTAPGAALDPMALMDGSTFVLPATVLTDPAHAVAHDLLAALPNRVVTEDEWPVEPAL